MTISASLLQNLINDGQITITPYDPICLNNNSYIVHNDGLITYCENSHTQVTPKMNTMVTTKIPKKGFYLAPNILYQMKLKESFSSDNYTFNISVCPELATRGLSIVSNDNGNLSISVTQPVLIYPEQELATLTVDSIDGGVAAVPIGGIIAWYGNKIPYGYCLCDGTNDTPDLTDKFIRGSNTSCSSDDKVSISTRGNSVYNLTFIMRYK